MYHEINSKQISLVIHISVHHYTTIISHGTTFFVPLYTSCTNWFEGGKHGFELLLEFDMSGMSLANPNCCDRLNTYYLWAKLSVSRKGSLTYNDESMNVSFGNILSQRIFLPGNEQLLSGCIIPVFTQRHNRISRFCPWTAATLFVLAAFIEGYGDDWQKRLAGWWVFCYYCIYGQQVRGVCSIMIADHARRWLQH